MQKTTKNNKNQAKPNKAFSHAGAVVGTVHTVGGLRAAAGLDTDTLDAVEIRLDLLSPTPQQLSAIAPPIILTPRCGSEGGAISWDPGERIQKVLPLLPWASAVDIELAQAEEMKHLLRICRTQRIPVILSFHDFEATPGVAKLRSLHHKARVAGAAVFKVATMLQTPGDLASLLKFAGSAGEPPVSVMGMGGLGRVSRISLGAAGSVLNYGWLHRPQVSGQWPARRLKKLIREAMS
jgi:3-dehydroquinate dehydratase-1